jgi:hypothetical protein
MATEFKQEYSAPDAQPVVLYAKSDANSRLAYPLTMDMLNPGFSIPEYDNISMTYDSSNNLETVVYTLTGATVATILLTYSSGNLTNVIKV